MEKPDLKANAPDPSLLYKEDSINFTLMPEDIKKVRLNLKLVH